MPRRNRKKSYRNMPIGGLSSRYGRSSGSFTTMVGYAAVAIAGTAFFMSTGHTFPPIPMPEKQPVIYSKNHCQSGVKPHSHTHVIVDLDAPPKEAITTELQRKNAREKLDQLLEQSTPGAWLSIYQLNDDYKQPVLHIGSFCDPGVGGNVLFDNHKTLKRKRQTEFVAPVKEAYAKASMELKREFTPLLRAINAVNSDISFYANDDTIDKRLVLITDGVQNTPECRAFKTGFNTRKCEAHFAKHTAKLSGVLVDVMLLHRDTDNPKLTLGLPLENTLRDFFKKSGARQIDIVSVR